MYMSCSINHLSYCTSLKIVLSLAATANDVNGNVFKILKNKPLVLKISSIVLFFGIRERVICKQQMVL